MDFGAYQSKLSLLSSWVGPRQPKALTSPLPPQALASSLEASPQLGDHIRHLGHLGTLTQSLMRLNVSPSLISSTVLSVLDRSQFLSSLELPLVDLRYQEALVRAVSNMKQLKRLRLGAGCSKSKSGTASFHEGDLRRIAKACLAIEELFLETDSIGFGLGDGYVDAFHFPKLRKLYLHGATSIGNKHLLAIVRQATGLEDLSIIGGSASLGLDDDGDAVQSAPLTTSGIAEVLRLRGGSLRRVCINVADRRPSPDLSPDMIPCVETALGHCTELRNLALIGPCLVNPASLPFLGSPRPSSSARPSNANVFSVSKSMESYGLSKLESLTLGLVPFAFDPLLGFIHSLTPSSGPNTSPLLNLKFLSVANPVFDPSFSEKSEVLKEALVGKLDSRGMSKAGRGDRSDQLNWIQSVKQAGGTSLHSNYGGTFYAFSDFPTITVRSGIGQGGGVPPGLAIRNGFALMGAGLGRMNGPPPPPPPPPRGVPQNPARPPRPPHPYRRILLDIDDSDSDSDDDEL